MSDKDNNLRRAKLSRCGTYRYTLERTWDKSLPTCVFVLLNPSTADATDDDNTIRRGMAFSRAWGCGRCIFVNLFAYRTPHPKELKATGCPIGPKNDRWITHWAKRAKILVAAWGAHP